MGTKNRPGPFNCYAAALPDEEVFSVLARDPALPATVRFWTAERRRRGKQETTEDLQRIDEAFLIAEKAEVWREANLDPTGDGIPSWKRPRNQVDETDDRPVAESEPEIDARMDMGSHFTAWRSALCQLATQSNNEGDFTYYIHEIEKLDHCFLTLGFATQSQVGDMPSINDKPRARVDDAYEEIYRIQDEVGYQIKGKVVACAVSNDDDDEDDEYAVIFDRHDGPLCSVRSGMAVGGTREDCLAQAKRLADLINTGLLAKESGYAESTAIRVEALTYIQSLKGRGQTLDQIAQALELILVGPTGQFSGRLNSTKVIFTQSGGQIAEAFEEDLKARPIGKSPLLAEPYGNVENFRSTYPEDNPAEVLRTIAGKTAEENGLTVDHASFDRAAEDLAVPDEVPGHRFAHFHKGERYAYAKGLEVSPIHLPAALDAMDKSGWELLAIFGATDTKNIGFIFRRGAPTLEEIKYSYYPLHQGTRPQSPEMDAYESGKPVFATAKDAAPSATDMGRGQEP